VSTLVAIGEVLVGKYRIERVLGQGGMGVVLAARHLQLDESVAVKLMLSDAATNHEATARFLREARAAARLQSAHVARVSDVGTLDDGRPYMVMEYLDGADLAQVLAGSGPLPVSDAVDYVLQASEAIAEAHSLGIVHRDLKPSNLFLTRRRDRALHVKVLDFGISKVQGGSGTMTDGGMTRTSALMGTPLYMSPEQMTDTREVDGRSDIWALGIILFELLSGTPPFMGDTLPQVCAMVLQAEAPTVSSRRADLPPGLDQVVKRCLNKQAALRYQTVAELAVELRPFAGRHGRDAIDRILMLAGGEEPPSAQTAPARAHEPLSGEAPASPAGTHAAWGETHSPPPAGRVPALIWAALAVAPILGAGVWLAVGARTSALPALQSSAAVVTGAEPPAAAPSAELVATPASAASALAPPVPIATASVAPPSARPIDLPMKSQTPVPRPSPKTAASSAAAPARPVASTPPLSAASARPNIGGRL
jgi:serine/threonine-protein kinase